MFERGTEGSLIQTRDKRVEELEQRLKSMEDLMKRPGSNQQSRVIGAELENGSRGLEARHCPDQPEAGTSGISDSNSNLNSVSPIAGENSPALEFGTPSPGGKCDSANHCLGLIGFSVPHCSL